MAYFTSTRARRSGMGAQIRIALETMMERRRRARLYRATRDELSTLTARELDDLGLNRGTIGAAARRAAYGTD